LEHAKYEKSIANLAKAQTELNRLRSQKEDFAAIASDLEQMRAHEYELNIMIEEKEKEVEELQTEIEAYKEKAKVQDASAEDILKSSPIFENIKKKADRGTILSEDEWQELNKLVIETLPNFYNFISSKKHNLNNNEFKICILRRLDFTPKTIAYMLNLSPSSITKIRNNMSKKLFGEEDNSKEFDKMLKQLS
jgi:Na+/phosphate symporter